MFGKKKPTTEIDKEQLELIENAQKRIKQKKGLYIHFVVFLLGAVFLIIANTVLGIGKDITFFGKEWFLYAILAWSFLFIYHFFNVFITHRFMGKAWEKEQLEKLVVKQQARIEVLRKNLAKEEKHILKSETFKSELNVKDALARKNSELTIIVAAAENNAIGKGNKLIWHLSDDLKRFKSLTNNHHIIMGRKTFESFPKPLPNRTHVVITRQSNYNVPEGVIVVNSLEAAIEASKGDSRPYIIGGGEIYKQAMEIADRIELTRVHENFEADTFFPEVDTSVWNEVDHKFHKKDETHDYEFTFLTYIRK
jgi:dihydrofolate reductase